ncbi:FKBP-type peptidyl-prolyl cis-trans isomerase [Actinomadura flavalba]|uniref:FKBP-type peptidyl-prolyl cis-trans isomerase n=1 Tax=Actinomadura flavalba TaxID=1120938 RepID=UPI000372909F|nr:FKBP-type peptidyl-prolyl cis-trans isomerase [Actinomadura flavalba]
MRRFAPVSRPFSARVRPRAGVRPGSAGALALVLAAGLVAGGCSSGGDVQVEVKGDRGAAPKVTFPKDTEPEDGFAVKTLEKGEGRKVAKGDLVVANYVGYRWNGSGHRLLASSFDARVPERFQLGKVVPGLDRALEGVAAGSRVVARVPPKDGYGAKGFPELQVNGGDTLVYVLDVLGSYARASGVKGPVRAAGDARLPVVGEPVAGRPVPVTMPRSAPPKGLTVRPLVQGSGAPLKKGQLAVLQYQLMNWRDGKVLGSSWADGELHTAVIGGEELVQGLDRGLQGQKVGSRVLVVVPPALGKAPWREQRFKLRKTDTLVFVVDVLGAH